MTAPAEDRPGREASDRRWQARSGLAMLLRTSVWVVPLVVSVGAAIAVATLLPAALTTLGRVAWWAAVMGASALALIVTDRLLRRSLPLATLLDVSLAFPHKPPSRFAVLRRLRTIDELRARIRDGDGESADVATDLLALVVALDEHDRATRGHSERVRLYAELLGEELGLDADELDRLRWAALLHDIGKLMVPADILNKSDRLDEEEWESVRRHPREGARLTRTLSGWLGGWVGAIEHHHEHVDGTGYPHGLEGEHIALGGRIVAVADAFETMTAARPYKRPMTLAAARKELVASAGTHFDERIVRSFLNLSVPRLRHVAGWAAWIAAVPGLWLLRRVPRPVGNGVVAGASVGILAVTGLVTPGMLRPPEQGPATVAEAPRPDTTSQPDAPDREIAEPEPVTPDDLPDAPTEGDDGDAPPDDTPPPDDAGSPDSGSAPEQRPADEEPDDDAPDDDAPGDDAPGDDAPDDDEPEEGPDDAPDDQPRDTTQVGHDDATVLRSLYLHAAPVDTDLRHDVLPLDGSAPDRRTLANYDTDVDDDIGLRLRPTDRGRAESRLDHRQRWAVDLGAPTTLAGRLSLTVWATPASSTGSTVALEAYVDHCTRRFADCQPVGDGAASVQAEPGTWQEVTVDVPPSAAMMIDDRLLVLTVLAGPGSDSDVTVAFDTSRYRAVLETSVGVIASPELPAAAGSARGVLDAPGHQ